MKNDVWTKITENSWWLTYLAALLAGCVVAIILWIQPQSGSRLFLEDPNKRSSWIGFALAFGGLAVFAGIVVRPDIALADACLLITGLFLFFGAMLPA